MLQIIDKKTEIRDLKPLSQGEKFVLSNWSGLTSDQQFLVHDYIDKEITRQDIIDSFKKYYFDSSDFQRPFLLCMIRGFAGIGYGNFRVKKYFEEEGIDKIKTTLKIIHDNQQEAAYNLLSSINMLGVSYISKIMYFAERSFKSENYSLIFDQRVANSLVKLSLPEELSKSLDVFPSGKYINYKSYCNYINKLSDEIKVPAENIEYYLFNLTRKENGQK